MAVNLRVHCPVATESTFPHVLTGLPPDHPRRGGPLRIYQEFLSFKYSLSQKHSLLNAYFSQSEDGSCEIKKNEVLFESLEKFSLNIDIRPLSKAYNLSFSVSQLSNVGVGLVTAYWVLLVKHSYHQRLFSELADTFYNCITMFLQTQDRDAFCQNFDG